MADRIEAPCRKDFYPAHGTSGQRSTKDIKWIVLHSTEGGTAQSVARWFQNPDAGGSTHLVVDDLECQRCLGNSAVSWGAKGANRAGFHIEQCGFARWKTANWLLHRATIKRAAYKTAYHALKFDIPLVWIKAQDLKASRKGITSHAECSKAFGGDHWDPGGGWPRWMFMWWVRYYAKRMRA